MKQLTDIPPRQGRVEFAGFRLDARKRQLCRLDGTPITLHSRAFDTLLALVGKHGQLVSKQELLDAVWPGAVVEENNLNQAISALRKAFGAERESIIKTIPGRGYCFVADTRIVADVVLEPAADPVHEESLPPAVRRGGWQKPLALLVIAVAVLVTVLLYQTRPGGRAVQAQPRDATAPVLLPESGGVQGRTPLPNSVAVLPFSASGLDGSYTWFEQGLHDEILTQLGRISTLSVISRITMLQYRDTTKTAAEIAAELNVATVLEGSVRAAGSKLRITLQMTDPRTNMSLWSETYDADIDQVDQIFAVQADIATNVARTLQAELLPQEIELVSAVPTNSPEAYKLFLESFAALVPGDYANALHLMEQAVAVDPGFVAAWTELSMLNTVMTNRPESSVVLHHQQALDAAQRALELNPDFAMAHVAMAAVKNNVGDWEAAAQEYALARSMRASLDALPTYSLYQMSMGDFTGAKSTLQRTLAIDPINLTGRSFLMLAYEYLGDRPASLVEYSKGEAMYANWSGDNTGIWLALGRGDTAFLEKSVQEFPRYALREILEVYDQRDTAVERLQLIRGNSGRYMPGQLMNAAMFAAYFDEPMLALDLMKRGLRNHWISFYLLWLPVFDELRATAEFRQFLTESGMVAFWRQHGWPEVCQPLEGENFECTWRAIQVP